ncbi:outer membrane protein assembly factor BamB family protein [Streptosporangium soli]|nr:PQQ-binding-like beta-propeller repeat protein [Streptosporangium sp. KLBMP 9127]
MPVIRPHAKPALVLIGTLTLAGCSGSDAATEKAPPPVLAWHNTQVNAVSRTTVAAGFLTATTMGPGGTLETFAADLASGKKLWAHPATMAGRLPGMGVPPPALIPSGKAEAVVAALDPAKKGRWNATLLARDARTGEERWRRGIHSTFGPQRCGPYVCLSEHTALATARVVVLDAATGETAWQLPGIAEVQWSDENRVVLLRLAKHPVLEAYELKTGKIVWQQPVEQALGKGVDMSGGWSFGATADNLVGYVAPYTDPGTKKVSTFGVFSLKLSDGSVNWMRPSVVRVYPSGSPGFAPVVRPVDDKGQYGGFARLDPDTGRVIGQIGATDVPGSGWWLAFPSQMERVGFLKHGSSGSSFDLASGKPTTTEGQQGWSFCVTDPKALPLKGQAPGFYSVAALCEYDLARGKRADGTATPPEWFTGSQEGWRVWRDEKGALHGIRDGAANAPGMYG